MTDTPTGVGERRQIGAGPQRALPDRRFHELVEDVVAQRPDNVAVTCDGSDWTYGQLNEHANRIAWSLVDGAAPTEPVVAVIAERTLHWAAAVLGIFKAGAVYLPIDPNCPADRVRHLLAQSRARAVVAAADSDTHLREALARWDGSEIPRVLVLDEVVGRPAPAANPGIAVAADQLAYIYFTSGSTGLPKGAMCEQLGMLNHLYAKIDVLDLGAGDVVAQNAPVSFDISLWQLIAAWLVGGRTAIIAQHDILDVRRFRKQLVRQGTTVAQLVPSYLDVLLTDLDMQSERVDLGAIRIVSVTGEAISRRLVQRWFARYPHIPLVNAYGATEASDDTTHAVITDVPETPVVPVGRPIGNVTVYVVDEQLNLVPPGMPGEIVFSGICVGRGYVNDPERTSAVFERDPYQPEARLYHSGDFGRWLADGSLEFLGRRDEQLKIRGMRVELGEVERQIAQLDGVRTASVIARKSPSGNRMAAFVVGAPRLSGDKVLSELRQLLPAHMLPATCQVLDQLPVNSNGKVDKQALAAIAVERAAPAPERPRPGTDSERRLATAWSEILGYPLDDIRTDDDFFALGGDSLAAVRLIVRMRPAVSLVTLMARPVLRDLAAAMESTGVEKRTALHLLGSSTTSGPTLVCVPDASGNAINFQPLAEALTNHGITVYGVELPGHDIGRPDEPFAGVVETAEILTSDMTSLGLTNVILWGQGTGAAIAVQAAHAAHAVGRPPVAVFIGSHHLDDVSGADRHARIAESLSDEAIKARIACEYGYTELDEFAPERTRQVAAAYRHDTITSNRYFVKAMTTGQPEPMPVPVVLVVADDDGTTLRGAAAAARWQAISPDVTVAQLPDGGRHFYRSQPQACAEAIVTQLAALLHSAS